MNCWYLFKKLLKLLSFVEAKIDFPDEELPEENLERIHLMGMEWWKEYGEAALKFIEE